MAYFTHIVKMAYVAGQDGGEITGFSITYAESGSPSGISSREMTGVGVTQELVRHEPTVEMSRLRSSYKEAVFLRVLQRRDLDECLSLQSVGKRFNPG